MNVYCAYSIIYFYNVEELTFGRGLYSTIQLAYMGRLINNCAHEDPYQYVDDWAEYKILRTPNYCTIYSYNCAIYAKLGAMDQQRPKQPCSLHFLGSSYFCLCLFGVIFQRVGYRSVWIGWTWLVVFYMYSQGVWKLVLPSFNSRNFIRAVRGIAWSCAQALSRNWYSSPCPQLLRT